jgi:hypothetical protein
MKVRMHALAGAIALLTIAIFWTSTVIAELFLSGATVAHVKTGILYGMFLLVPALAVTGGSGFSLSGKRGGALVAAKKKRMPFIAANGLIILLPAAFYLQGKAVAGDFDRCFVAVQALELLAGVVNLTLMGLNMRDGLRLRRPTR